MAANGNNGNLPLRIKCAICKKSLLAARFSNNSLAQYRSNIARYGLMTDKLPECKKCKGGNREELQCSYCDTVKDLEQFTQVQKRKGDHAKCKDCQQDVDDRVPDVEDALIEEEIKEELISGRSTLSSMSQVNSMRSSRPGHGNPTSGSSNYNPQNMYSAPSENGVFIPGDLDPGRVPLGTVGQSTNWLSNNNSRTRTHSIVSNTTNASQMTTTTTASTSTWVDFPPDMVRRTSGNRAAAGPSRGTNPGFVTLRAVPQDPVTKVKAEMEREAARKRQEPDQQNKKADSDEEGDDDWEL